METEVLQLADQIKQDNLAKLEQLKKLVADAEAVYSEVQTSTSDKPFYKSKGFYGGAVSVLAGAAGLFGVVWTSQDATTMQALGDNLWTAVTSGSAALSGILALWGRIKAQGGIKFPWSK